MRYLCQDCHHEWIDDKPYGYQICDWCKSMNIQILEGESFIDRKINLIHKIINSTLPTDSFGYDVQMKIINHSK